MRTPIDQYISTSLRRKRRAAGWPRRSAVILGAAGLTASAGMLVTAGSALAGVGAQPGDLQLIQAGVVVTTGPLSGGSPTTWQTTTACPSGQQGSAEISEWSVPAGSSPISLISPSLSTGLANSTGFGPGTFDGTVGALLSSAGITASTPGTLEWVVGCYSGASASGSVVYQQSTFISVASGATNWTASSSGPVVASTTTTLAATPNPVAVGATATLTATEVASDSTHPAGSVQFEADGTDIGTPVAVSASGVATTTTTFSAGGNGNLSAVFVPTNTSSYTGSTGTFALSVGTLTAGGTNPVSIGVTVPATGTFSVTVAPGTVTLAPASPATTPDETATGTLNQVTVNDSRNTVPGWSVSGQESTFTGPGTDTIPASSLGWTPTVVGSLVDGAVLGGTVAPLGANSGSTGPGLGTAAALGYAAAGCGFGTNVLSASLLLDIPSSTPPGSYAGTLTITYVETQPSGVAGCVPIGVSF